MMWNRSGKVIYFYGRQLERENDEAAASLRLNLFFEF